MQVQLAEVNSQLAEERSHCHCQMSYWDMNEVKAKLAIAEETIAAAMRKQ